MFRKYSIFSEYKHAFSTYICRSGNMKCFRAYVVYNLNKFMNILFLTFIRTHEVEIFVLFFILMIQFHIILCVKLIYLNFCIRFVFFSSSMTLRHYCVDFERTGGISVGYLRAIHLHTFYIALGEVGGP